MCILSKTLAMEDTISAGDWLGTFGTERTLLPSAQPLLLLRPPCPGTAQAAQARPPIAQPFDLKELWPDRSPIPLVCRPAGQL